MIIAHVVGYFQPEFGYKEYFLAKHQARLGHRVHIVTSDRIYPFPNIAEISTQLNLPVTRLRNPGVTEQEGFTVHRLPTFLELGTAIIVRKLCAKLKSIHPDAMIIHGPAHVMPALAIFKAPRDARILVEDQQFEYPKNIPGKIFYWIIGRWLCQASFRRADIINFVTPQTEMFAEHHYSLGTAKRSRIPLGYDPDLFTTSQKVRTEKRKELGIRDDQCVFLTAGKLQRGKNLEILLEAFARITNGNDSLLYILGGGDNSYLSDLNALGKKLGISSRLRWHPFVPQKELAHWYNMADVGIWPDWPTITILEALGCSLPVILPDRQTVRHLAIQGNGELFIPGSVINLSQKMNLMLQRSHRQQYIKKASSVKHQYSYQTLAQKFIDALR